VNALAIDMHVAAGSDTGPPRPRKKVLAHPLDQIPDVQYLDFGHSPRDLPNALQDTVANELETRYQAAKFIKPRLTTLAAQTDLLAVNPSVISGNPETSGAHVDAPFAVNVDMLICGKRQAVGGDSQLAGYANTTRRAFSREHAEHETLAARAAHQYTIAGMRLYETTNSRTSRRYTAGAVNDESARGNSFHGTVLELRNIEAALH